MNLPSAYQPLSVGGLPHPFVVLEGVSGIGKSTLARELSRRLGATYLHTLPAPHTDWSAAANERLRALPQFAFYASGLLHAADVAREARRTGPVVADRYASSVVACHAAVHEVPVEEAARLLAPFGTYLETPTRTYYLRCSEEALRRRLAVKRDVKQDDLDLFATPGRLARLLANFHAVQAGDATAVLLDTDGASVDDLAERITAEWVATGA